MLLSTDLIEEQETPKCSILKKQAVTMSTQATAPTKSGNLFSPVTEDAILDWDCALETPPSLQRSGQIVVTLREVQIEPSPV